jgi:cytochrome P450
MRKTEDAASGAHEPPSRQFERPGVPRGPRGIPRLGSALEIARSPLGFPERCFREYGDVVRFGMAGRRSTFFFHPDDIEQVLLKQAGRFRRRAAVRELVGGLMSAEGEEWKRQRRVIAPALTPKQVGSYADTIVDMVERWCARGSTPRVVDIHREMLEVTLNIVALTLFDADLTDVGKRLATAIEDATELYVPARLGWRSMLPIWIPSRTRTRFEALVKEIRAIAADIVTAQRKIGTRSGGPNDCLLARLMAARDEDGWQMNDEELQDQVVTFILAGHETTGLALTYALYLLATHPETRELVTKEATSVLGNRRAVAGDVERLPICGAVINEAMRLYPSAALIGRECTEAVEIGGVRLEPGDDAWIHLWITHRDPRWFSDPHAFRPQRWLDGSCTDLPRFAFLPFGGGPRVCIGVHFAMMELVLALATTMRALDVEVASDEPLEVTPLATLQPLRPVRLRITRRA